MIREVHPSEILISACIFAVLAAVLFGGGYWVGHRGMDDLQDRYDLLREAFDSRIHTDIDRGLLDQDDPLRINVECHGDASDSATVRMANQIAHDFDIPAYAHGNCLTHSMVDVPKADDNPLNCHPRDDGAVSCTIPLRTKSE
jgi:hypothetical protein